MKKTITLSLLFAAATCSYAADSADLVDLSFNNGAITLSSTQQTVNVSGETKDNLISSTLPADAGAGTVLGYIEFTLDTNYAGYGNITIDAQQNILSIISTTGATYGVAAVYTAHYNAGKAPYHSGHLVLNVGSQTADNSSTLSFYEGPVYNASITMIANGDTAADGVTITLKMGDNSISISTTEALTGSFADMVVGGGQANGSVTVTSVRTHKTVAESKEEAVPEPTTATLSLLALAGLAARRRRK